MVVEFIGVNNINFEKDGKAIRGMKIYVSRPVTSHDNTWDGKVVETVWVSNDAKVKMSLPLLVGQKYDFVYEGFGRKAFLAEIVKVENK